MPTAESPPSRNRWSTADSEELYAIDRWGLGHFQINKKGNIAVSPEAHAAPSVDLRELVEDLRTRGLQTPALLRFSDVLRARIESLNGAFETAIADCGYTGNYRGVFPIKVNQARTVVDEIVHFGEPFHYGLEAGSKAELVAILAIHRDPQALIVCNGYKDDEYIRLALLGSKLGPTVILVAEKPSEIQSIHRMGKSLGITPDYGIRVRLSAPGAGRWKLSGGDKSKFGLAANELVDAVEKLRSWNELSQLRLLHFHLGSQVSAIRSIKNALREAACLYVELRKMGCIGLDHLDVGGGLGVDYDGSQTNFPYSMNYSMQEYANDVVHEVMLVCNKAEVPHPHIVSESGRAISAHHSVLVVDVLEVSKHPRLKTPMDISESEDPLVQSFLECFEAVTQKNLIESYHDALAYRDQALQLFSLGRLPLMDRVQCEQLFWGTCRKVASLSRKLRVFPEELKKLERQLSDTYFLNFSLFQSLPDSWAIDQVFPIMPIHRLDEEPTERGVLADITCDSDGRIDRFVDLRDIKDVLELHPLRKNEPYYIGIFLVGAYQEILGDMHNLFGDTNTVHISMHDGGYTIEDSFPGETISEVLRFVNYTEEDLLERFSSNLQKSTHLNQEQAEEFLQIYKAQLSSYTYLKS